MNYAIRKYRFGWAILINEKKKREWDQRIKIHVHKNYTSSCHKFKYFFIMDFAAFFSGTSCAFPPNSSILSLLRSIYRLPTETLEKLYWMNPSRTFTKTRTRQILQADALWQFARSIFSLKSNGTPITDLTQPLANDSKQLASYQFTGDVSSALAFHGIPTVGLLVLGDKHLELLSLCNFKEEDFKGGKGVVDENILKAMTESHWGRYIMSLLRKNLPCETKDGSKSDDQISPASLLLEGDKHKTSFSNWKVKSLDSLIRCLHKSEYLLLEGHDDNFYMLFNHEDDSLGDTGLPDVMKRLTCLLKRKDSPIVLHQGSLTLQAVYNDPRWEFQSMDLLFDAFEWTVPSLKLELAHWNKSKQEFLWKRLVEYFDHVLEAAQIEDENFEMDFKQKNSSGKIKYFFYLAKVEEVKDFFKSLEQNQIWQAQTTITKQECVDFADNMKKEVLSMFCIDSVENSI